MVNSISPEIVENCLLVSFAQLSQDLYSVCLNLSPGCDVADYTNDGHETPVCQDLLPPLLPFF